MQSHVIPPLKENRGPHNSLALLARNWCSPIAVSPLTVFPSVNTSVSKGKRTMGTRWFQLLFVSLLTAHLPFSPGAVAAQLLRQLSACCRGCIPIPLGTPHCRESSNPCSEEGLGASQNNLSACLPKQVYFFPSPPPIRNLRIVVTDLSSHFGKEREPFHSPNLYIFQTPAASSHDHQ